MIFEAIPSFRDKWKLLQKQFEILTSQSLRLGPAKDVHVSGKTGSASETRKRRWECVVEKNIGLHCGKTTPGVPGNPIRVTVGQIAGNHRDPCRIHRRSRQNFKTSNGRLKTLATSIRGRLWKVCFLGPRHGSAGFPVLCDDPERVS